jgi:hypothetical protein
VAAVVARAGASREELIGVLESDDPTAFEFAGDCLKWRDITVSVDEIKDARKLFAISFGSCSFEEPVLDLQKLGLP